MRGVFATTDASEVCVCVCLFARSLSVRIIVYAFANNARSFDGQIGFITFAVSSAAAAASALLCIHCIIATLYA